MIKTTLYDEHIRLGGKIVDFHGIFLPIKYKSEIEEHKNVRENIGLFDVSHMGEFKIKGADALEFCQWITCNDVSALSPGKAQYTAIMRKNGGLVDDAILYQLAEGSYLLVVNASNIEKDFNYINENAFGSVEIHNCSKNFDQLAVQGPFARKLLDEITKEDISGMKSFTCKETQIDHSPVLITTTGYTGEDGVELYYSPKYSMKLWNLLLEKGKKFNIMPIGLGARDTLRLEMGFMLYGNDINDETTPLEAGLEWIVKFKKEFLGKEKLLEVKKNGLKRLLTGICLTEKGVPRQGYKVVKNNKEIGIVTSGTMSPSLNTGIALAYVDAEQIKYGEEVAVEIRNKLYKGKFVKTPFITKK